MRQRVVETICAVVLDFVIEEFLAVVDVKTMLSR
jgi:hypothetical protein